MNILEIQASNQALIERFGIVEDRRISDYIDQLTKRLLLYQTNQNTETCHTVTLNTSAPLALSSADHTIFLSVGLLRMLNTEDELAFVLAHELAHKILNHSDLLDSNTRLEIEADNLALKIVNDAGYNPLYALSATKNIYENTEVANLDTRFLHPGWFERKSSLERNIPLARIHFQASHSRAFEELRQRLAQL